MGEDEQNCVWTCFIELLYMRRTAWNLRPGRRSNSVAETLMSGREGEGIQSNVLRQF